MRAQLAPPAAGQAVIAVLAGEPLGEVAARFQMREDDLVRAVEVYRIAGEAALIRMSERPAWYQITVASPALSHHHGLTPFVLSHLGAELGEAENDKVIHSYHFLRKDGGIRLRVRPNSEPAQQRLAAILDRLAACGQVSGWVPGIYEPETHAFGGPAAMRTAHTLFCADSHAALASFDLASPLPSPCPRKTSVLLTCALLRAAGLDVHEQGDVWARICARRDPPRLPPPHQMDAALTGIGHLMAADPVAQRFGTGWRSRVAAFEVAGRELAGLARTGVLQRGLRAVLARHVLFLFNRAGMRGHQQAIVAYLAHAVAMDEPALAVIVPTELVERG
ncbi:thiopeptide-type bacteriocin biosynthesis protein [Streptosporangium sp. NPDC001681]|uniref:thiopeptide-type bacteriocin biosynthesis protein n=1 Tax=Streptosporangium sp. NPDC001681 TaxID=3154395 RepID=UPI00332AF96E